ncbi:MAG TPA: hypothetical protein VLS52_09975 [Rudaea sp.]|nr:hypothetical protein [Rudaea sp.]
MKKVIGHLVVLDPRSLTGLLFAGDNNDGTVTCGDLICPTLRCESVSMTEPHGISVVRVGTEENPKRTSLFLPLGTVALIVDFFDKHQLPVGFHLR